MAYTQNIPQTGDSPTDSQPLILGNFQEIATAFNLNHGDFNGGNQGKHEFVQMPEQGAAPATAAAEGAVYTKDVSGATQLFWREESSGTEYQMTNQQVFGSGQGSITLPGGLTLKYGFDTNPGTTKTVTFTAPFASAVYSVTSTAVQPASSPDDSIHVRAVGVASFVSVWSGTGATNFYWFAVGV